MARHSKRYLAGRRTIPTMTYLTPKQRRAAEAAAETEELTLAGWLRQLVRAEVSRLQARAQLNAQLQA